MPVSIVIANYRKYDNPEFEELKMLAAKKSSRIDVKTVQIINFLPPIWADLFNAINITDNNASMSKSAGKKSHQSEADRTIGPVKHQICYQAKRMCKHEAPFASENIGDSAETESADEEPKHEHGSWNGRGGKKRIFANPIESEKKNFQQFLNKIQQPRKSKINNF